MQSNENELMGYNECFRFLMRKLNSVACRVPRKQFDEIQYIISQLENLHYFPSDIRLKSNYEEK